MGNQIVTIEIREKIKIPIIFSKGKLLEFKKNTRASIPLAYLLILHGTNYAFSSQFLTGLL